jgi:hypothetical protein
LSSQDHDIQCRICSPYASRHPKALNTSRQSSSPKSAESYKRLCLNNRLDNLFVHKPYLDIRHSNDTLLTSYRNFPCWSILQEGVHCWLPQPYQPKLYLSGMCAKSSHARSRLRLRQALSNKCIYLTLFVRVKRTGKIMKCCS